MEHPVYVLIVHTILQSEHTHTLLHRLNDYNPVSTLRKQMALIQF
jgi:hypothetical protein